MRHKPENPLHRADWKVDTCSMEQAIEIVTRLHYAAGAANTAAFRHALYPREAWPLEVKGVALWLPPTPDAARATFPEGDPWRVLTLSRLVIDPDVPTNGASFLMGASTKLVAASGKWDCLVTYADERQGHTGAIYKATGWEYVGMTKSERIYVKDARMVSRKAGPKTRTHAQMLALGCECVGESRKHKFRKVLSTAHPV